MTAQSPAAGNPEYAVSIEKIRARAKKLCTAVVAAALCAALLWASMGTADYIRVMNLRTRPLLCVTAEQNGSSAYFRGLGYSFDAEGMFYKGMTKVDSATFYIFGIEVSKL